MQKIILNLMLLIFFLQSCNSIKNVSEEKSIETKKYTNNTDMKIDTTCNKYDVKDCHAIFSCHYKNFIDTPFPFIYSKIDSTNDIGDFLECCIFINSSKVNNSINANNALSHYYLSIYTQANLNGQSPLQSGVGYTNRFYRILHQWNSREAFEICLFYISKNRHDSMGHGDCTNLAVKFFEKIMMPKIVSIDGLDYWTYYDKHVKDVYPGPSDCYDSYYNAMYPLIKKAWDEGKIVLKTDQVKTDK
jgi:hypothetical protein